MSKTPFTHEDYIAGYEYFRNLSQEKNERIKKLEAENKAIIKRAESAEQDWQLAEGRFKALEAELIEVKRARNVEQGAWEEVKQYQDENKRLREQIKRLETVMQKCIDAMKGSNCLEEQWLSEALKG